MEEGEKPTRYFFNRIKTRKATKNIRKLKLQPEDTTENKTEIISAIENHYSNICETEHVVDKPSQNFLLSNIKARLTDEQKTDLDQLISLQEVKDSVKSMPNGKSPGPDGLSKEFYVINWTIIGKILTEVYNNAFAFGSTCDSWNGANVAHIPIKGDESLIKN